MKEINLQNVKSLLPPLYYELSKVKEYGLAYKYYQVRHPGAIFSTTFTETVTSLNSLYKKVNNIQGVGDVCSDKDREELVSLTKDFLLRLTNYFEGNYEVFLCFSPQFPKPPSNIELYKWFKSQNLNSSIESYFLNTDNFLKKYRKILNALKHSSNQLRIFQFITTENKTSGLGFYLEGVNADGAVGPDMELHPLSGDRYTAWSYNLHLKNFYFLIYKIATEAELVVKKLCNQHNITLPEESTPLSSPNLEILARELFQNISRLNNPAFLHFPQESTEITKIPSITNNNESLTFTEYKSGDSVIQKGTKAVFNAKGDGFSRTFSLPYMG